MARLEINLLGSFQVSLDGKPVSGFDSDKVRGLLTYLAVEEDQPHRRERLTGLLWPDYSEVSARTNLRSALANLRKVIGDQHAQPPFLIITRQTIQFNRVSDSQLDIDQFLTSAGGEPGGSADIERLESAVALYQGEFLEGFFIPDSSAFEEWAQVTRQSLQRRMLSALHRLAAYNLEKGAYEQALSYAQRQIELDPFQEAAHQQVMLILAKSGQRNEAIRHYDGYRELLTAELGVEPLETTQLIYQQLLQYKLPKGTVTFLFTDIEGSTQILSRIRDQYEELLVDQRRILRKTFTKYQGREVDAQGDAFFVAFPRATQAVSAAVEIQRAQTEHQWPGAVEVRVRMGLHTGEPLKAKEGYIGMDVHRAARIAHAGHGGQVLLSETTASLVMDELPEGVRLLDLGRHHLKDLHRPEQIHQLAIEGLPSEFPPLKTLERLPPEVSLDMDEIKLPAFLKDNGDEAPSPVFVGRERELERLDAYLQNVLAGQGQVAFIVGGPGRGKTSLIEEFTRRALEAYPNLLVASGNCNTYTGIGDPYLPFKEILDMLSGGVESRYLSGTITKEHASRLWRALPLTVEALVKYGSHVINALLPASELKSRVELALPSQLSLIQRLAVSDKYQRAGDIEQSHLFQQITNVLKNLAAKHPTILVLDDLQWADNASINLLFYIGRRLQGYRIMIIGAYRPVEITLGRDNNRHPLETVLAEFKRTYGDVWVNLSQVGEDDGRQFVGLLLDTEPNLLDTGFRDTLFEHTSGHPLFTIELLRALQERGDLAKDREGYWIRTPKLDWETLPARVEGVIEERIARLDGNLREILSVASIEGEEFTLQVIAQLTGIDERRLLGSLNRELDKRHRLIKERGTQWVGDKRLHTYRFRHILFLQYLYGELGEIEREWLHGEVATTLEVLYGDDAHLIAPQLAFHFKLANHFKKSLQYLIVAARQARDRYANQAAIDYYAKALDLVHKGDLETTYEILLEREAVHALMGNRQERETDLDSLEILIEALGHVEKQAEVDHRKAKYAQSTGDYPKAIAAAEQSAKLAREAGNMQLIASAQTVWGRALAFTGDLDEARLHLIKALELAQNAQSAIEHLPSWLKIEVGSLNNLAYISNVQGDHEGSRSYLERALRINRQISDRRGEGVMLQNLGVVSYDQGDFVNAEKYWEKALKIFQEIGDRQHEAMVMTSMGNISSDLRGDYAEAKLRYGRGLAIAQEVGDRLNEGMAIANIGIIALNQYDFTKAKRYTQQAADIYVEIDLKPAMSGIYLFLGNALTGLRQMDEAVKAYMEAIQYAEELDQYDRKFEAQAGLAKIAQVKGELAQALTTVDVILSQMADDQIQGKLESEATMRIYLICYQILQANQDSRAEGVLEIAHTILQEQAARIPDETIQQMFLENIPWHREIVQNTIRA